MTGGPVRIEPPDLVGRWRFSRSIVDHRAGSRSSASGSAEFGWRRRPDLIAWSERGLLAHGDSRLRIGRTLLLECRAGGWQVTFADGSDFHPWAPGSPVSHLCRADLYRGRVEAGPGGGRRGRELDRWTIEWRVRGPGKDLEILTEMTRIE